MQSHETKGLAFIKFLLTELRNEENVTWEQNFFNGLFLLFVCVFS